MSYGKAQNRGRSARMERGVTRDDSLMFMAQNASVETVTARTHKMVKNDFMLRARRVYW